MAVKLKEFRSTRDKYDWSQWADGNTWKATRGKDFDCTCEGFISSLYQRARRKGLTVRSTIDGDTVTFQFSRPKRRKAKKS